MKAIEKYTTDNSEYYMYTPTPIAKELFFYPICVGYYEYLPGYSMQRNAFDSLLLMEITEGDCIISGETGQYSAGKGNLVLIDCYKSHGYKAGKMGWSSRWMHIDGANIQAFFKHIMNSLGYTSSDNVLIIDTPKDYPRVFSHCFASLSQGNVKEATISSMFTGMLADVIDSTQRNNPSEKKDEIVSKTISFISNHFTDDITLRQLADMVNLSPYYFNRLFRKNTGYTPYEYVINTRLSHSRYLLKTTGLTVKEICFASGFSSESRFCILFKEKMGMSPSEYRK